MSEYEKYIKRLESGKIEPSRIVAMVVVGIITLIMVIWALFFLILTF